MRYTIMNLNKPCIPKSYGVNELPNLTNKLFRVLKVPLPLKKDKVHIISILIYGKRRCGKTTYMNRLVKEIIDYYGENKVNVLFSRNIGVLYSAIGKDSEGKPCNKNIIALVLDDPLRYQQVTGGRKSEQSENIADREELAHIFENKLNTKTGLIIEIIASQRIKLFEMVLRDASIRIFKTALGDEEETNLRRILKQNSFAYRFLEEITDKIYLKHEDEIKSWGIIRYGTQEVGRLFIEPSEEWYLNQMKQEIRSKEKKALNQDKTLEEYANKFLLLKDFDPSKPGIAKAILKNEIIKVRPFEVREILQNSISDLFDLCRAKHYKRKKRKEEKGQYDSKLIMAEDGESFGEFAVKCIKQDENNVYAEILNYTLQGWKQAEIANELGMTQPTVSDYLKRISERYIGYYFERWYCSKNGVQSTAGNTNKVDYEKDGIIKSLKCLRAYRVILVNPEVDCKPEIKRAIELGATFTIVLANILWYNSPKFIQETKALNPSELPHTVRFFDKGNILYS